MSKGIKVIAIKPFWRYAVLPANLFLEPAMPFYTRKSALAFIERMHKQDALPVMNLTFILFRKDWWTGLVEEVQII